jgi:hypothetical protein
MFKEGDLVEYKTVRGPIVFICELSLSILVGDEFPKRHQTRVVVYPYEWDKVKLVSDSLEIDPAAKTNS